MLVRLPKQRIRSTLLTLRLEKVLEFEARQGWDFIKDTRSGRCSWSTYRYSGRGDRI